MSGQEFGATHILGRTIDLLNNGNNDAFDVNLLLAANTNIHIITMGATHDYVIGNSPFAIALPNNVDVNYIASGSGTETIVESGQELIEKLEVDVKIQASYMAVTAKAGATFSYENTFKTDSMYAITDISADLYDASLLGPLSNILATFKPDIMKDIALLPEEYKPENREQFRSFSTTWGTHVVTRAAYGKRYQLIVSEKKSDTQTVMKFKASFEAEFSGVTGSGSASGSIEAGSDFKEYQKSRYVQHRLQGGDPAKLGVLNMKPYDAQAIKDWAGGDLNVNTEALIHADVTTLGEIIASSADSKTKKQGKALEKYIHLAAGGVTDIISTGQYGPRLSVHPITNSGTAFLSLIDDPEALIEKVDGGKEFKVSDDGKRVDFSWSGTQPSSMGCNIYCGRRTTVRIEITSGSARIWFSPTYSMYGFANPDSPWTYCCALIPSKDGSVKEDHHANLSDKSGTKNNFQF